MANIIQDCTAVPDSIPADGSLTSTITATVIDDTTSQVASNVPVTWSSSGPGNITPTSGTSDAQGKVTTTLTATDTGVITVTVTTDDDSTGKNTDVTAKEPSVNIIDSISAAPTSLPSDGSVSSTITVTVVDDSNSQPASGVEVTWALTGQGEVTPSTSTTNAQGQATTSLTANPDSSGILSVSATTPDDTQGKSVIVLINQPLLFPRVPNATEADNYTLDHYDISFGVYAVIPRYEGAAAGHALTFHWGDLQHEVIIQDPDTDLPMIIDVSEMGEGVLSDGVHSIYYVVTDEAGNERSSTGRDITVDNGGQTPETLPEPSVPEADDGYINISDASNGVDVKIDYPDMATGDLVTIYWLASDSDGIKMPEASISTGHMITNVAPFTFNIDGSYFFPNGLGFEGKAQVYYTVQKADNTALALSYTKECLIDTLVP